MSEGELQKKIDEIYDKVLVDYLLEIVGEAKKEFPFTIIDIKHWRDVGTEVYMKEPLTIETFTKALEWFVKYFGSAE